MRSLETVFDSHLEDLNSVRTIGGHRLLCPICLEEFAREDVGRERLSIGDVWPKYIREKSGSTAAARQVVLLCKSCNSMAGSRGDKQMQLRERIKDAEKAGKIHGERRLQVILSPGEEPIELRGTTSLQEGDTAIESRVVFAVDEKTGKWARNDPRQQERFQSIAPGTPFHYIIHSHHELRDDLTRAGWLTSAYLFAFYTFGYRYILDQSLEPVRKYIHESFDVTSGDRLQFPTSDDIGLTECREHFYRDPEIGLVIPLDGESPVHLQVSILDYHVRLPFRFVFPVLQFLVMRVPEIYAQLPTIRQNGGHLYVPIACNKSDGHDCLWDYVLGKPLPAEVPPD